MRIPLRLLWSRLLATCFQTRCVGCGSWGRSPVCPSCAPTIPTLPDDGCPRCMGAHLPCPLCTSDFPLTQVYACAPYHGVMRKAIHALKFDGRLELVDWLTRPMRHAIAELDDTCTLVPIPLSPERLRERGFNQADLLARATGRPVDSRLLRRMLNTPPQVGQGRTERWDSMKDAFNADPAVANRQILLIDDVLTTGSTLSWAAHALRAAGAKDVRALVVARAQLLLPLSH